MDPKFFFACGGHTNHNVPLHNSNLMSKYFHTITSFYLDIIRFITTLRKQICRPIGLEKYYKILKENSSVFFVVIEKKNQNNPASATKPSCFSHEKISHYTKLAPSPQGHALLSGKSFVIKQNYVSARSAVNFFL